LFTTPAVCGLACFSLAALSAADNATFRPKAAAEFDNAQKTGGVILAAESYVTDEQTKLPFGKLNPNKHGALPVLLVVANESGNAMRLETMRVSYVTPDRQTIDAVPPSEVQYLNGPTRPNMRPSTIPGLGRNRKNPLSAQEIEGRAFAAKILPPGDKAHGFFYFNVTHRPGSLLYVTGIQEAATGSELFFVEIPLK
jgi:hypothetical protein